MDSYKKERSSKQHLKVDKEKESLLLANPMACDGSPNNTLTENPSQLSGLTASVSIGQISRSSERSSFKGKSRSKSPSLFKFFQRGGGSRKVSAEDEEDYVSSSSDHEDPFSPHATHSTHQGDFSQQHSRRNESPKSSSSSIEHYVTLPRKHKRKTQGQRDSGFSSERDSISQTKDDREATLLHSGSTIEAAPLSPVDNYKPGGMEALEMLHDQLQILVKQESCDDVDSENNVYDQVIAGLSRQVEDLANSLDCLRQSDHHLRLSLRLAEQRALEAETKLNQSQDRCQRAEQRYMKLASKYQVLSRRHKEMERMQQKSAVLHQIERASASHARNGKLPQRVHSQNQFDRRPSEPVIYQRPSTAQGMHPSPPPPPPSLSHTETCV